MIRLLRLALCAVTYLYLLLLLAVLAALRWHGEQNTILALLLLSPPPTWLAPMLLLAPACLLFGAWRAVLAQIVCAALLLFVFMPYGWNSDEVTGAPALTVYTQNVGECSSAATQAGLSALRPDVVLLQDAKHRAAEFSRALPAGWQATEQGEFACLSRFPIIAEELLPYANFAGQPLGARFEVQAPTGRCAVYNIHFPTPRQELLSLLQTEPERALASVHHHFSEHLHLEELLLKHLAREKLPLVVGGDWNHAAGGYAWKLMTEHYTDAFAAAGQGWGFTFPANTQNMITRGPWLRLDQIWTGPGWRPVRSRTTPDVRSQHRGVFAALAWTGGR